MQQFSNKSVDMSLRVASLDYLGIVAARLRKDAVTSRLNEETIDDIISFVVSADFCVAVSFFYVCVTFLLADVKLV